jgi:glycine dehydrogenase
LNCGLVVLWFEDVQHCYLLITELAGAGHTIEHKVYFDTLKIKAKDVNAVKKRAQEHRINLRYYSDGAVGVALDETTGAKELKVLLTVFGATAADEVAN